MGKGSAPYSFSIGQEGKGFKTQPETSNDELREEMESWSINQQPKRKRHSREREAARLMGRL